MNKIKEFVNYLTGNRKIVSESRPGLRAPVVEFDRHGKPLTRYYLDVAGEKDYAKNSRIKRVKVAK